MRITILITVLAAIFTSCNRNEIFEREQYKHVIALISEGSHNIFAEEHEPAMGDEYGYTIGHIAASCGGSLPTTQSVSLNIVEDRELLQEYNSNTYAMDGYRFARYLPANRYNIEQHSITIEQGERTGRMEIRLRAGGLSPDSAYFIPFRVEQASAYELNPNKSTLLYQVYLKNFWASTMSIPDYSHRSNRIEGSGFPLVSMISKKVFPVSGNEVRITAGNKIITEYTLELIEKWAIRLLIDDKGNVTITPWSATANGMKVTQLSGNRDYPNVFRIVDDGFGKTFKTFLLYYEYTDADNNVTYTMEEELKIEHIVTVK